MEGNNAGGEEAARPECVSAGVEDESTANETANGVTDQKEESVEESPAKVIPIEGVSEATGAEEITPEEKLPEEPIEHPAETQKPAEDESQKVEEEEEVEEEQVYVKYKVHLVVIIWNIANITLSSIQGRSYLHCVIIPRYYFDQN